MRRVIASALTLVAAAALLVALGGAGSAKPVATYKIQVDNAFGLVTGADFKVAGVKAGSITALDLDPQTLHAVVSVSVTQQGFGDFRSDVFCQTRPQSLIGEYFIECDPGHATQKLQSSTIPVSRTQTTIAPDLLADIMRLPYRQRFSIIIGELGAAVAGRSGDLQDAIRRAVPALTQTDNLLHELGNDSQILQQLTVGSDTVVSALADNTRGVANFIDQAGRAAQLSAARNVALGQTFHKLPAFLEQLKPTLVQLSAATDANTPALQNLSATAGQLNRFLVDLTPFSRSSKPALVSLGQASVTGRQAVIAARPTVADLNRFAKPAPELAKNLGIVLPDLDNRSRAVEADPRSPGGKGYTGLEALLQYVFNQALAINTFGPLGHVLAVDGFVDKNCSPYATPQSVAAGVKASADQYRKCYAWLGKNQPGVNIADPSNPGGTVPDPGGAPPGQKGPTGAITSGSSPAASTGGGVTSSTQNALTSIASTLVGGASAPRTSSDSTSATSVSSTAAAPSSGTSGAGQSSSAGSGSSGGSGGTGSGSAGGSAQQLLSFLLSP